MKTTKKQREASKKHYKDNKHIINERNKHNRKRQQLLKGFWLLLIAVLVNAIINQILK
jgi:Na+/glutamate symporter